MAVLPADWLAAVRGVSAELTAVGVGAEINEVRQCLQRPATGCTRPPQCGQGERGTL